MSRRGSLTKNAVGMTHMFAVTVLLAVVSIALVSQKQPSIQGSALPYSDVNWLSQEGIAIHFLASHGIINGFADGTFRGSESVNRAQAVKMILRAAVIPITHTVNNGKFTDVAEGEWYTPYVMTAAFNSITRGSHTSQTQARFQPREPVNAAEFLTMIGRAFHLEENWFHGYRDVPQQIWYEKYAGSAWHYDLFPNRIPYLEASRPLSRNEIAVALYKLFHQPNQKRGLPWWKPPNVPNLAKVPHEPPSKFPIFLQLFGTGSMTETGSLQSGTGSINGTGTLQSGTGTTSTGGLF